jgi:hypothetical protein
MRHIRFNGALYRGVDVIRSAAFKTKYDSHVGTTITFVTPTSFSTSDAAAGAFTRGIQFVVPDGDGVSLDDVSAFDEESEAVVNGPSSWEVVAATMTPTGTLVVVIERLPDFASFLTSPGDACFSFNPSRTLAAAFVFGAFHQVLFLSCPSRVAALNVITGLDLPACHLGRWCCCGPHFRARFFQEAQLIVFALVIFYEAYSYLAVKFPVISIAYPRVL